MALYSTERIDRLIARGKYRKAVTALRQLVAAEPANRRLRQQLADVLARAGQVEEALALLRRLADELTAQGFYAKAVAVAKKMQRIDPEGADLAGELAERIKQHETKSGAGRARPGTAAAVPEPVRTSPLFADFSPAELASFIRGLRLRALEPGEIIISEGAPGDSVFVVASGRLRVYVRDAEGRNRPLGVLGAGDFCGEIGALSGQPRTATLTAASTTELLELDHATLAALGEEHPQLLETLQQFWDRRAASLEEQAARQGRPGGSHRPPR